MRFDPAVKPAGSHSVSSNSFPFSSFHHLLHRFAPACFALRVDASQLIEKLNNLFMLPFDQVVGNRAGGSYIFVHRLLMEHFAEMDVSENSGKYSG
jgi:hypothetical protein